MKNLKKISFIALIASLLTFQTIPVQAETTVSNFKISHSNCHNINEDEYFRIENFLRANHVDSNFIKNLMRKLCKGIIWDSMKTGVAPISVTKEEFVNSIWETKRYPDGSLVVSEIPKFISYEKDANRYVTGCDYTRAGNYAAYWKNCQAIYNWGVYTLFFTFNYSLTKDIGSRIDDYSTPGHTAVGNITNAEIHRISPNHVQYIATWTIGPWMSKTIGFNLKTKGTEAQTYGL